MVAGAAARSGQSAQHPQHRLCLSFTPRTHLDGLLRLVVHRLGDGLQASGKGGKTGSAIGGTARNEQASSNCQHPPAATSTRHRPATAPGPAPVPPPRRCRRPGSRPGRRRCPPRCPARRRWPGPGPLRGGQGEGQSTGEVSEGRWRAALSLLEHPPSRSPLARHHSTTVGTLHSPEVAEPPPALARACAAAVAEPEPRACAMAEAEAEALPCSRRREAWGPAEGGSEGVRGVQTLSRGGRRLGLAALDAWERRQAAGPGWQDGARA